MKGLGAIEGVGLGASVGVLEGVTDGVTEGVALGAAAGDLPKGRRTRSNNLLAGLFLGSAFLEAGWVSGVTLGEGRTSGLTVA